MWTLEEQGVRRLSIRDCVICPLWSSQVTSACKAGLTVVASVGQGGGLGVPSGLASSAGHVGGGVGEQRITGVVPAGAHELEEVDDEDGFVVGGLAVSVRAGGVRSVRDLVGDVDAG